jgi:pimeloyl-ACP methyl ester carboxylesterase
MSITSRPAALALALVLLPYAGVHAANTPGAAAEEHAAATSSISGKAHYALRDGLRIYLWEKYKAGSEDSFGKSGKVALLVHGGTWSGRPDFDLQIRDYSLMDALAMDGYDVWALDIHGYGHSDKRIRIGRVSSLPPPTSMPRWSTSRSCEA